MIGGYSLGDIILWVLIFFVVWKVIEWLWNSLVHSYDNKKKWIAIIIIIIAIYFFVNTQTDNSFSFDSIKTKVKELSAKTYTPTETTRPTQKTKTGSCEEKAGKLVPKEIVLKLLPSSGGDTNKYQLDKKTTWADKTEIKERNNVYFRTGTEKGEKQNYFYPRGKPREEHKGKTLPKYFKKIVSSDGTILGERTFSAELILKETDNQEYTIVTELVEFKIFDCHWIEEETETKKEERLYLTNFKSYNENPESYLNKKVKIKGALVSYPNIITERGKMYGLRDNEGYVIKFFSKVEDRIFDEGKIYTILGEVVIGGYMMFEGNFYAVKEE